MKEIQKDFIHIFYDKKDTRIGIRHSIPNDAKGIVDTYKDVYGWDYLYPWVYDVNILKKKLIKENHFWFTVEEIESEKIIGAGCLTIKDNFKIFASKLLVRKDYQGRGIMRVLGAQTMFTLYKSPEFKKVLRIECDIRAKSLNSQKFLEKVGTRPYGFIPNYNNYSDKRNFDCVTRKPFTSGRIEPVIMNFAPLKNFWKKRQNVIKILDNEDIISFYDVIKKMHNKMDNDELTLMRDIGVVCDDFEIKDDFYKGCVLIKGYLSEKTLGFLLKKYSCWNVIEWYIPTTVEGLNSQLLALENGFKVVGYNPGSINNDLLLDSILMCYFPNGVDFTQFKGMNLTEKNQSITKKVIKALKATELQII